jgi:hypothetical protein
VFNSFIEAEEDSVMSVEQLDHPPAAHGDVSSEEKEHEGHKGHVEVAYNGLKRKVEFEFKETMGALRQRAVAEFGTQPNAHALSLFTHAGVEFGPDRDNLTIREAGIKNDDHLLLRPGVVRGG